MAKKRRTSRYATQAQAESQIRYAPQQSTLADLLASAGQQRDAAVQGSLAAALGIGQAADAARGTTARDYGGAAFQQMGSQNFTRDQLAKLGPAADLARGGAESEGQAARQRLQTMALGAMDELRARKGRAAESADYAIQRALQQYGGDAAKVGQQLQNLSGQQGAFAAQRENQLAQDAAKRSVTLRGQTLSHKDRQSSLAESRASHSAAEALRAAGLAEDTRHHRATEAGKGHGKPLTPEQSAKRISAIRKAQSLAGNLIKQGGHSKADAGSMLTQGFTVPVSLGGGQSTTQQIAPIDAALAQAGVELATQGKIGAGTAKRLKAEQGIDVSGKLPVMSPAESQATRHRSQAQQLRGRRGTGAGKVR